MERNEFDIREHQRAGLTPNARVCLHAVVLRTWCCCWSHIVADKSNNHQDNKNKENEFEHSHGLSPPTHLTYHI